MSPICVASFPRSGTHFLIESINYNFHYGPKWFPYDEVAGYPTNDNLVGKTHCPWHLLKDKDYKFIYIYRNFTDVCTSIWYYHKRAKGKWTNPKTVDEMPEWDPLHEATWCREQGFKTYWECWESHLTRWIKNSPGLYFSYEQLHGDFNYCMDEIGKFIGKKRNGIYTKPPLCGIYPRKGIVGDAESHMSSEVLKKWNGFSNSVLDKLL